MADADPSGSYWLQLLFLVILIMINAFFAASEMAMVSVNKTRIKVLADEGKKSALILQNLLDSPNKFLSTIQVVITLAGFLQSASAATSMAGDMGDWIDNRFGITYGVQIAVVGITLILSYFNLVFGELAPKRIAIQYSEKLALFFARPVKFFSVIAAPFVWLLSKSVTLVLKILRMNEDNVEEMYSEEEIKSLLEVGQETGLIDEAGKEMITSIFDFDDKLAYEIMTPRTDVFMINVNDPLKDHVDELLNSRFSRVPFYDKDNDDIVGVLYMKDYFLKAYKYGFNNVHIKKILQKPLFVPENKKIDELFAEMQANKIHMAFLIDEYGGVSGIVTTEDIVEEIVGDIDDEYDDYEPKMKQLEEDVYLIDGNYYLDDINDELGLNLTSDDYETIGGLMIDKLGEIPDENEKEDVEVQVDNYLLKVESVKERRIDKVKLTILEEEILDEENGDKDSEISKEDKRAENE